MHLDIKLGTLSISENICYSLIIALMFNFLTLKLPNEIKENIRSTDINAIKKEEDFLVSNVMRITV